MASEFWLTIVLLVLLFLPFHSYVLYPLIIRIAALIVRYRPSAGNSTPPVSIIISAYNEENNIRARVRNLLEQEYDTAKMEILIGSDCSSDGTNTILLELQAQYPGLIRAFLFTERRGKAGVVNDLVQKAQHDIVIFTDANTEFTPRAVRQLVEDYTDPKLGGISGRIVFYESARARKAGVEESNYFEYDSFLKQSEGTCGILIGAFGGFFSIRKKLYRPIPLRRAVTDDLYISLSVLSGGYRFLYKPEAVAYEESAHSIEQEYRRKVRYSATNFQTMMYFGDLLFNRNLLLSYALWSHKVIRWFVPLLLFVIFFLNLALVGVHPLLDLFLLLQGAFYAAAVFGYVLSRFGIRIILFSLPYYFVVTNIAVLAGLWKFLRGRHTVIWQPAR
jgi:cellulose synthase/poly-beta-1,6-N-acetylglucosamine synthase-like glycosyltransferase